MSERAFSRIAGISGIGFVVFIIVGFGVIAGFTPGFDASREEIAEYMAAANPTAVYIGELLEALGHVLFLIFVIGLSERLRRGESAHPMASLVQVVGVLYIAVSLTGIAALGPVIIAASELDPTVAGSFLDTRNVLFLISLLLAGSLAALAGAFSLTSRALPRWAGWSGVITGLALLMSLAFPTSEWPSTASLVFVMWVLAVSVLLLRPDGVRRAGTSGVGTAAEPAG